MNRKLAASCFVGRVGGLALALGIGTAMFAGAGTADAQTEAESAGSVPAAESAAKPARGSRVATQAVVERDTPRRGTMPSRSHERQSDNEQLIARAAVSLPQQISAGPDRHAAAATGVPSAPAVPAVAPIQWMTATAARRDPASAASAGDVTAPRGAQVWTGKGITVTSEVGISDGVILGAFQATSASGAALSFTALGGSGGGKVALNSVPGLDNGFTVLPYANWLDPGGAKGIEQVRLGIRELTLFDAVLIGLPVVGMFAGPVINLLQDTPLINDLLAPLIGSSAVATIDVDVASLAPGDTPLAFTYDVESFDGVKLSTNFFPAAGLAAGATAPTTIIAPGFGAPGGTRPFDVYALKNEVPGILTVRAGGYNVVTFDPRGEFDSGGVMRTANPNYEGRDTSAIVSWIAGSTPAAVTAPGDPQVGMIGGSYGGALQLASARDPRIDAMVPVGNWNTLLETFYPTDTFKTGYSALYLLNLIISGARVEPQLYWAVATGLAFDWLGPWSKELMNASTPPLDQLRAPTLLARGIQDVLVPLAQGDGIAETVLDNGLGTELKEFWFTGGHGAVGLLPQDQSAWLVANTLIWLDSYVKNNGSAAQAIPNFQWYDQTGAYYSAPLFSFQDGFNNLPDVTTTAPGGLLGILPLLGGSGPGVGVFPLSLVNASPAANAIDVAVPSALLASGTQVVGAPTVSFSYRGLGTSGAVFAQVIDNATGAVLGNVVTPVPVILDGLERTVTADIAEIAYTVGEGASLTVQITSSATAFANAAFGVIDIANITVSLPNRTA